MGAPILLEGDFNFEGDAGGGGGVDGLAMGSFLVGLNRRGGESPVAA